MTFFRFTETLARGLCSPVATTATQRQAEGAASVCRNVATVATLSDPLTDLRHHFEERAAIRGHDGGLSRADAEAGALADCVARWRALNPLLDSENDVCVHCGKARPDTPVLVHGGNAWLHRECWEPMKEGRTETARAAIGAALETTREFDAHQETLAFQEKIKRER